MFRLILLNFFLQSSVGAIDPYTQLFLRNKGYSYSLVGIIYAVGQVASIFFPILFCMIADKTKKTKTLFFFMVFGSLGFIVAALNNSLFLTFLSFFIASACFWTLNPMNDGYQNRVLNGDSSKYGIARAMGTFGFVVSLVFFGLTGFPDETNNKSISLVIGIALLLFFISAILAPQEKKQSKIPITEKSNRKGFSFSWFNHKFYILMGIVFVSRISESVIDKMLSSYFIECLNLGNKFSLLVALGAASEFVMLIVGGRLLQKRKVEPYTLMTLSSLALTARLLIYRFFPTTLACFFAALLHSFNFGALHLGVTKFMAQNVNKDHYSVAMSLYWAIATNLPEMLGTLAGGFVIDVFGYSTLFSSYSIFPAIAFVLFLGFKKKLTSNDTSSKLPIGAK